MTDQTTTPAQKSTTDGLAITSLVLGIISIVMGLGLLSGIPAIVFGSIALKKRQNSAMSITGIATGAVATLFTIAVIIFFVFSIVALNHDRERYYDRDYDRPTDSQQFEPQQQQS